MNRKLTVIAAVTNLNIDEASRILLDEINNIGGSIYDRDRLKLELIETALTTMRNKYSNLV